MHFRTFLAVKMITSLQIRGLLDPAPGENCTLLPFQPLPTPKYQTGNFEHLRRLSTFGLSLGKNTFALPWDSRDPMIAWPTGRSGTSTIVFLGKFLKCRPPLWLRTTLPISVSSIPRKISNRRHGPTFAQNLQKSDQLGFKLSQLYRGPTFRL